MLNSSTNSSSSFRGDTHRISDGDKRSGYKKFNRTSNSTFSSAATDNANEIKSINNEQR